MSEGSHGSHELPPFDENELSAQDREIVRRFEMREHWDTPDVAATAPMPPTTPSAAHAAHAASASAQEADSFDELLTVFSMEVSEDIALIRHILQQFELDDHPQPARFSAVKKPAHKIRGTAGAMDCRYMAHTAHIMEIIVAHGREGTLCPVIVMHMLTYAADMLEEMLWLLLEFGTEDNEPYQRLAAELERLSPEFSAQLPALAPGAPGQTALQLAGQAPEAIQVPQELRTREEPRSFQQTVAVDAQRIERLALHIEALAELHMPMEHAEEEVEQALWELRLAQARLHDLEETLRLRSTRPEPFQNAHPDPAHLAHPVYNAYVYQQNHPTSSLIARILSEASQSQPHTPQRKMIRPRTRLMRGGGAMAWEQQEQVQALEQQNLLKAFQEALTDAALASARVSSAFLNVRQQTRRYITQAATARNDLLALRSAPFHVLFEAMRQEIDRSPFAQVQPIHFEVTGEATEIDQDILRELKVPLLQLLHTCIENALNIQPQAQGEEPRRIWMRVQSIGSEVMVEIGFSMMVQGGAVDAVRASLQHLHSTISSQRNATGGISFHIRLPRSRGAVRCLQVRMGEQHIVVPFAQVQRIGTRAQEDADLYFTLAELLAPPLAKQAPRSIQSPQSTQSIQPTLKLVQYVSHKTISVGVDEVEREVELMIRPLAPHLQRPGITGAAIDGNGSVLLMVDLPELVRHSTMLRRTPTSTMSMHTPPQPPRPRPPVMLIADDSTSIRQSLFAQFTSRNYSVHEAQDGIDALEKLVEQVPDVFILDMDMPNLSGLDLLNIMHLYPELAHVKVVMLTSHDSERDRRHAFELGAHLYLTKQNRQEPLVDTIQRLLLQA